MTSARAHEPRPLRWRWCRALGRQPPSVSEPLEVRWSERGARAQTSEPWRAARAVVGRAPLLVPLLVVRSAESGRGWGWVVAPVQRPREVLRRGHNP